MRRLVRGPAADAGLPGSWLVLQLVVLVVGACTLLAACGGGGPGAVQPSGRPAPAARSVLPQGDPRSQIRDAYAGLWHAYVLAARTADYQPGALSPYAAGDALMILSRSLYADHQDGVVLHGAPVLDPEVTGIIPAARPDIAAVTDCGDDSRWRQYTTAGKPASGAPAGRHRIYAQLRLFSPVWKVTSLAVERAGTC